MGVIKYIGDGANKKFNVGQALKDGWGIIWTGLEVFKGVELQDRTDPSHKTKLTHGDISLGTFRVFFEGGGWLCLDHAIDQYEPLKI